MKEKGYVFLLIFILHQPFLSFSQDNNESNIFDNTFIHEIRLSFPQENYWDSLTSNYENNEGIGVPYLLANVIIDGEEIDSVGIRFKGFTSYIPEINKRPMKIDFNEFIKDQRFGDLRKLNLNVAFADPSMFRDFISYSTLRDFGIPAPRTSYSRVYINDIYWGLYQNIEQIDKSFLGRHFYDNDGNLYKNQAWSFLEWEGDNPNFYQPPFELKTNEDENDWSNFIALLDIINNTSNEEFLDSLDKHFDIDSYLKILSTDVVLNNWDSHVFFGRNFYLYDDPESGKFSWLPWDYNLSLGAGGNGVRGGSCDLKANFVDVTNGSKDIEFINLSDYNTDVEFHWDFGDGNNSIEENPKHTYDVPGIFEVCLITKVSETCIDTFCKNVDTNFNPENCGSISNGSSPYPPDFIFKKVVDSRPVCCDFWSGLCEVKYEEIKKFLDGPNRINLTIDLNNNMNVLINRLMEIDSVKEVYYQNICDLLNYNFTENYIFSKLEKNRMFIEEIIVNDSNYLYTLSQFNNDYDEISNEKSLKFYVHTRIDSLKRELGNYTTCNDIIDTTSFLDIAINEFMASNTEDTGISDSNMEYDDWIELYNNTDSNIDLTNYYLSDDFDHSRKWVFPEGTSINSNEYLIVWCDNDNESQDELHSNFKLDREGEEIILTSPTGIIVDSIRYSEQESNISFARIPNGTGSFQSSSPSFGQNNETTSTLELDQKNSFFSVFPNPSINEITIRNLSQENLELRIVFRNSNGIVVKEIQEYLTGQKINISDLNSSFYFVEIYQKNYPLLTKKLVLIK